MKRSKRAMNAFVLVIGMASIQAMAATHSTTIKVSLAGDSIQLSSSAVKAGRVTFEVSNSSPGMAHEMVVLKTESAEDNLPMKPGDRVDEASLRKVGEVEDVKSGKKKIIKLKLDPGRYILICNVPGHYKNGMHATLTVEK